MAHFKIKLGQTTVLTGTWWTTTAKVTVKDLTGWTARIQFRPDHGSSVVLLDLHTNNGGMTLDGDNEGNVVITIDDSNLTNVPQGDAVFDMVFIDTAGEPHRQGGTADFDPPSFTPASIPA